MINIITPVWNEAHLTAQYLFGHNIHYLDAPDIRWVIIDNGSSKSTAGIYEYWKRIYGNTLTILRNEENLGFPKACNQGAKISGQDPDDILIFLNNDVEVKGDYITPIEKELKAFPGAIVGPDLISYDTGWNVFDGKPLEYLVGWCVAMRRQVYNRLGGFDERYTPAYYEDIDLCYNALQDNIELRRLWLPLIHIGEQSGHQLNNRREITEANREKFARKWGLSYESK